MKKIVRMICSVCLLMALGTFGISSYSDCIIPTYIYAAEGVSVGEVTGSDINVRSGPSKDTDKLGTVSKGESVTILGEEDGWYKIEFDEGIGYIYSDYVTVTDSADAVGENGADADENAAATADAEEAEEEEEVSSFALSDNLKTVGIIAGVVVLLLIIIAATIASIRRMDEEDDYDDDYDDYDDGYDDGYDDDYDDEYYEEEPRSRRRPVDRQEQPVRRPQYSEVQTSSARRPLEAQGRPARRPVEEQEQPVRRPVSQPDKYVQPEQKPDPVRYMSNNPDDYRIDIDPKFFETSTLPKIDDSDAPMPVAGGNASAGEQKSDREADLAAAMKKMDELQKEIERIKNES